MFRRAGLPHVTRTMLGAAALALCAGALGCDKLPSGPVRMSRAQVRSVILVDWTPGGYAATAAHDAVVSICASGANTVTFITTAYQSDPTAGVARVDPARTPSEAALRSSIAVALGLGKQIALKPHVDLDDGSWRGHITPRDPARWFDSYRAFLLPLAAMAESVGAAQFVIGTELAGTLGEAGRWRDLIRAVRAVYHGSLVYAASWDEAGRVPFWDACDLVGVDFYFPVASRTQPGRLELLAGWQPWLDRLEVLHRQSHRPILLSEIGYRSVDGAGMRPYSFDPGSPLDLGEHADLYWAALEATRDKEWIAGLSWWNARADGSGGMTNTDYTPFGKPAVGELSAAWRAAP